MTAAVLAPFAVGDGARYAALAAALAILVLAICFVAALVRLGILANLLSRPVLIGYMTGIALVMMVSQLGTITGAPVSGDRFIDLVLAFAHNVSHVHRPRTVLAASALVMLLTLDRRAPKMPGPGGAGSHGCCSGGHSVWAPR